MVRYERALSFLRLIAENQEATILRPTTAEEAEFSYTLGPLYHIPWWISLKLQSYSFCTAPPAPPKSDRS